MIGRTGDRPFFVTFAKLTQSVTSQPPLAKWHRAHSTPLLQHQGEKGLALKVNKCIEQVSPLIVTYQKKAILLAYFFIFTM